MDQANTNANLIGAHISLGNADPSLVSLFLLLRLISMAVAPEGKQNSTKEDKLQFGSAPTRFFLNPASENPQLHTVSPIHLGESLAWSILPPQSSFPGWAIFHGFPL